MTNTFAKTRTKLMVMLMVLAIVALVASIAITAFSSADADEIFTPVTDAYELQQELDKRPSGTIFKLQKDITPTSSITVSSSVTIDLNGYEIRYANSSSTAAAAPVITVTSGTLTLKDSANDSAPDHTISYRGSNVKIDGGLVTGGKAGGVLVSGGSFIFEGGTIAGNSSSTDTNGGGVTMKAAANTFIMKSGATISHNNALMGGGVFVLGAGSNSFSMEGGRIANNTATMNGGGVYLTGGQGILLEVKGGEISSNTATNGKGGGIYVDKTITAVISNNTPAPKIDANSAPNGGGMYVAGTLTMTGGLFSLNTTTNNGAGIYADGGTLNISGGEISNNKASYGNGAGVYMTNNSTVTLTNATIRANSITGYGNGAGVYMENGTFTMSSGSITSNTITGNGTGAGVYFNAGTLKLSGTPVINENKIAGGKASNLQLVGSSTFVTVTAAINANAKIGISVDSARTFTSGYGKFNTAVNGFFSDDTSRSTSLTSTGTDAELTLAERVVVSVTKDNGEAEYFADIEKAWATISGPYTFRVQLRADVETSKPLVVSAKAVILDLNGYMIRYTGEISDRVYTSGDEWDEEQEKTFNRAQSVIVVLPTATAPNISFTITDSRPTASSHEIVDMAHSVFPAASEDDAQTPDPTIVTANIFGGLIAGGRCGIFFDDEARGSINFTFSSGTVAGAKWRALYFIGNSESDTATFESGAAVRFNGSNGVYVRNHQTIIMNGGDFSYNNGNGLSLVDEETSFVMNGGKITNNGVTGTYTGLYGKGKMTIYKGDISYNRGYGIDASSVTGKELIITGGSINHNHLGGIRLQQDTSKLTMTGGEIMYNNGEGFVMPKGSAEISNAQISYNGNNGINVSGGTTFSLKDSTVSYNGQNYAWGVSGDNANGVVINASVTVTLENCILTRNNNSGLRLRAASQTTMTGGEISWNGRGCVVMQTESAAVFTLKSGEIMHSEGNGGVWISGGTFNMDGGSIHDNTGGNWRGGGGLLLYGAANANLNAGSIHDNYAPIGGGVLMTSTGESTVTMKEGFEIYNNTAETYGGGVYVNAYGNVSDTQTKLFVMEGGSIYGNTAMYGGGVAVHSEYTGSNKGLISKFQTTGGRIYDNKAIYGGGIYYGVDGILEMQDSPYVKENTLLDGKTANNLYVAGDQRVKITGEIKYAEKEEKIGLTVEGAYYGKVLTEDYYVQSYKNTSIKGFYMDDSNLGKVGTGTWQKDETNSQMELILDVQGVVAVGKWNSSAASNSEKFELLDKKGSWDEAYDAVTKGENGANALQLLADVGVMKTVKITSSVTLDLNGYMLQSGTGDYLLPLISLETGTSATLTITDSTYAVGANGVSTASVTHWFTDPTTEKWAELRGGVVHGLVQVNGGKLEFDAGYIVNGANLATPASDKKQNSAGVWVAGGEFVMTDSNNAAIYYNRSSGILHYGGKTTINGGKVSYNYSQYYGGAMVVGATDCTINGGELCYNVAGIWGGAIDMYQTTTGVAQALTINGGSIHDNVVRSWANRNCGAGGIQVQASTVGAVLTLNGGSIINNRVESNGYTGAMNGGIGLTYGSGSNSTSGIVFNGGTVVIAGNTVDGVENNLQLNQGKLLNISKAFSAGSRIGVSLPNESSAESTYVFTENYTSAGNGSTFLPFFADDPTNCLTYAEADGPYSAYAGELVLNAHLPVVSATMQHFNLTMPSCKDKKDGSPEYWKCTLCDRKFVAIEPSFVDFDEERDVIPWEHNFTSFSYYSPTKHRAFCSDCNAYEELDHVFSDWMASGVGQHSATCSVCTREITEKCAYEGAENRNSNATSHWQECPTCGTHYEEAVHEVVAGTYTRLDDNRHVGTCKDCGYAEVTANHTPDGTYVEKNAQEHYQTCTGCHQAVNTEAHTLVEISGDDEGTTFECQFCHYQSTTADHKRGQLTSDASGHWYPCEMHPGEKLGASAHELEYSWDNKGNGKHTVSCETCGYSEKNVDCSYGTEYEVEGDYHFRKCSECGAKDSADQNGTKHTPKYMFDSNQHWYECTECHTITTAKASHVWEDAYDKEQHFQRCADHEKGCDVMRNVTPHEFDSTDWQINNDEHWQKCTGCDFETDKIKHVTTTVKGENGHHEQCTECGWTGSEVEHKWLDGYRSNSNGHFYRCEVCGYDQAPQAHDYEGQQYTYVGGATGQHSILCRVCNYKFTETCVNVYQDKTATTHTATCEKCGNSEGPQAHNMRYGSNQTQHWDVCADCGYGSNGETAKTEHSWNAEGNCSTCGKPSNDPLDGPRVQAKNDLEQKANEAKAALKGASSGTYEGLIDSVLLNATLDIDSAMSQDEIDSIIERALADFIENVVKNRKIYAGEQLDAEQQNILENNLPEGITDEERTRYEQAIAAAKAAALADVNAGSDLDAVDGALAAGIEAMNKAVLNTAKKIAQEKVRDQAQAKKDEIDQKVENGELTPEQGEDLKDIIDKEAGRAEDNIENADSFDEVNEEQKRGDDVMQDVVDNPDLADEKSKGRDDLDDEANKKKDDIQKKADQEKDDVQKKADEDKKDVDNDPTLSDEEKEQKKDEIQQEADRKKDEIQKKADEQKKDVDDAKKDAENKVTDAKTPEEVKDAVDQGKNAIDKVGSTTDPAKGSFLDWFKNNPLPLGIAAITLGAMLFIIIILSIAARKRKTK